MAITPMTVLAQSGQTPLTIKVIPDPTDTIVATVTGTEAVNGKGLYNFNVDSLSGRYHFHVETATGALLGVLYADLINGTTPVACRDLALAEMVPSPSDDVYHADVDLTYDDADGVDKYTITWFKNAVPVKTGVTLPTLEVFRQEDGSVLIATSALINIGDGNFKYNELANRMASGDGGVAYVEATIDGAVRDFKDNVGRDNTV